ncbi:hypothetical protein TRFO_24397 [Tritrichomonas foetus]|uniref:DUF3447 domain-containing protein n=1 Tax=Tritrichomonas foetus TaxID=1144522 RepID=A0A1J4K8X1_9EUKA|nr:hypothetical protein TRFO_24397 [Tritrichomonas foetus]|eukprot:OHT07386.1 hypothetical protein TRFO_24397 [Tritrichomonas foetus]
MHSFARQRMEKLKVIVNDHIFIILKDKAISSSLKIRNFIQNNQESNTFSIVIPQIDVNAQENLVIEILEVKEIFITFANIDIIEIILKEFEINYLQSRIEEYKKIKEIALNNYQSDYWIQLLENLELSVLNHLEIDNNNTILSAFQKIKENQFIDLLYNILALGYENNNIILMNIILQLNKKSSNFLEHFKNFVIERFLKEVYTPKSIYINYVGYLIYLLLEDEIIDKDMIINHWKFYKLFARFPKMLSNYFDKRYIEYSKFQPKDSDHKYFCSKESSMPEVFDFIRRDNVLEFQTFLQTNNIDINRKYSKSYYERHHLLNEYKYRLEPGKPYSQNEQLDKVSFLQYSAFYGSLFCFKYLLINNAEIENENLGIFAISGNNYEIIHLCDQNECSFHNSLPMAIQYHYHSLAEWLIENQKDIITENTLSLCIRHHNYITLKYLLSKGIEFNKMLIYSVLYNNYHLTKYTLSFLSHYINQKYEVNEAHFLLKGLIKSFSLRFPINL